MRKFIKKATGLALAATLALSLTACGSGSDTTTEQSGTDAGDGSVARFVIGAMGPVTGENASYGTSVKQGAQIAIDEINEAGGINGSKFELNFLDDQADAQAAQSAYNKLMDEGANAILGAVTSGATLGITELTAEDGILQVTPSGSAQECTANDNAFRICFTDPLQGTQMADLMADTLKYKKVAVIYDVASDYSKGMHDAFVEEAKAKGIEIVADESFTSGDKDFNTQLTTIKASGAEAIFVPGYYQEAAFILTQAKKQGMDIPFLGGDGWDGVLAQLKDDTTLANGVIFLSPFFAEDTTDVVTNFVTKYVENYRETPDQFAADAYDGVYAIAKAYEKAGSAKHEDLIKAMHEIEINGATGTFKFDENGEPEKDAKFIQIVDGKYAIYEAK